MSILKTKKIQIGSHATASNNFVIEQPDTPDGTIRINRGNIGADTNIISFGEEIEINKTRLITTGMIRFGADVDSNVDRTLNTTVRDAYIRVQGGNLTNFGANLIMYGDEWGNPALAGVGRLRVDGNEIIEWGDEEVNVSRRLSVENAVNDEAAADFVGYSYNQSNVLESTNRVLIESARAAGISDGRYEPALTLGSGANPRNFWIWNRSSGTIRLNTQWLRTHRGIELDAEDGNPDRTIASTVRNAYTRMNGGTAGHSGAQLRLYGDQNTSLPNRGIGYTGGTQRWGWDTTSFILNTAPSGQGTTLVRDSGTGRVYTQTSSRRMKKDIEDAELSISNRVIEDSQPVWYRSRSQHDRQDWSFWGFIAEDLAEVDPRLVTWGYHPEDWETDDGRKLEFGEIGEKLKPDATLKPISVKYDMFAVHLVNVVKEQKKKIEDLTARIEKLEKTHYN